MVVWNGNHYESFLEIFEERFNMVIKNYKKKTNAVLTAIIDEEGRIIHSDTDISIESENKKYLGIYSELIILNEDNVELQDINSELEINSYYEKWKLLIHNFICLIEQLSHDKSINTILPKLLDLSCILPDSKRREQKILKCFLENKSYPHKECLLIQL
jgi:hypothetical protein